MSMTSFPGTFMNGAYSHEMKQSNVLQEQIRCLDGEVMKLTVENTTLRTAFQCLAGAVGLRNVDPCQFTGTSFPQVSMSSQQQEPRPTWETSPLIRFWDREDWERYLESPEGLKSKRGTLGYLEDEDGNPPSPKTGKAMRKLLRGGWAELVNRQLAPTSWGRLSASGHKFIHDLMENAYPMFRFATNGWKLDYLASTTYPAWRKVHLDDNGRWKLKKGKELKTEDDDEDDEDENDDGTGEVGMKRKAMQHVFKTEAPDKKLKGMTLSASPAALPSPPPSDTSLSPSEVSTKGLPPTMHEPSLADSTDDNQGPFLFHDSPCTEESIAQCDSDTAATASKITINPLAALALAAHKVREMPPLPPHDTSQKPAVAIETQSSAGPVVELADAVLPATTVSAMANNSKVDSVCKSSKGSGKAKMRPGPTKNGRNLCTHRWRKQVQSSRSTEEFQKYYNGLTAIQQKGYDDEAAALVANKNWDTKSICNGTLY
ncbi:hypothetical protein BKA83DRAFT_4119883 [Pisolithus microcarpus]|nr:hypothetical protein BKA83DRAFT_4119883 [Pisolithus microcarpus]